MEAADTEYEFPSYNDMDAPEGVWTAKETFSLFGGVLLKPASSMTTGDPLLKLMMPRIQSQLRRLFNLKSEADSDLFQWSTGSKYYIGGVEALLRLMNEGSNLEVRVRGPVNYEKECFFFLEEILGVIDQVNIQFQRNCKNYSTFKMLLYIKCKV